MAAIPGLNQSAFAMIYFAMMPITALAYDERCKWDILAVMMPYKSSDIVLSKYMIGYIGMGAASVLSLATQFIIKQFQHIPFTMEEVQITLIIACVGLILLAINLPFMFKMGVEKGRWIFMVIIATTVFVMMMAGDKIKALLTSDFMNPASLTVLALIAALLINVISVTISISVFKRKAF